MKTKFRYVLYKEDGTSEILFESKEFKYYMDAVKEYKQVLLELAKKYDVKDCNNPIELQFFKEEDGHWYFHGTAIDILLYEIENIHLHR